jgi:predicted RNase H-like HicB family nuclease
VNPKDRFLQAYSIALATERMSDNTVVVSAWPVDLPGCIASGSSKAEAVEQLTALLPAYLDSLEAIDREIPAPKFAAVIPGVIQFYDAESGIARALPRRELPQQKTSLHETPNFELESIG